MSNKAFIFKLALFVTPFVASAGLFQLKYESDGIPGGASANQPFLDALADEVNKKLPAADTKDKYLKGMSNANSMAAAGVTTSYGTVFKKMIVGVTASGGVDLGSKSLSDFGDLTKNPEQFAGFGAQAALVAGINVGNLFGFESSLLDLDRLNVYLSGFAMNRKFDAVTAKYFGVGLGAQYRLIDSQSWVGKSVTWTGVDVSTGILFSKLDVDAEVSLKKQFTTTYNGQAAVVNLNTSALIDAKVSTISIPLEASTGLRLFYFFKLIAGLGMDINMGSTEGNGSLSATGNASGTINGTNVVAKPIFDIDGSKGPDIANLRVFAGPHIEFGVGSVFANVHKSLTNKTVAVNGGVNFFW